MLKHRFPLPKFGSVGLAAGLLLCVFVFRARAEFGCSTAEQPNSEFPVPGQQTARSFVFWVDGNGHLSSKEGVCSNPPAFPATCSGSCKGLHLHTDNGHPIKSVAPEFFNVFTGFGLSIQGLRIDGKQIGYFGRGPTDPSDCELQILPETIFDHPVLELQRLTIDCRLAEIPTSLFRQTKLRFLDLSNNALEKIPTMFFQGNIFPMLADVNLANNKLVMPKDAFSRQDPIQTADQFCTVDLSNNQITEISPESVEGMTLLFPGIVHAETQTEVLSERTGCSLDLLGNDVCWNDRDCRAGTACDPETLLCTVDMSTWILGILDYPLNVFAIMAVVYEVHEVLLSQEEAGTAVEVNEPERTVAAMVAASLRLVAAIVQFCLQKETYIQLWQKFKIANLSTRLFLVVKVIVSTSFILKFVDWTTHLNNISYTEFRGNHELECLAKLPEHFLIALCALLETMLDVLDIIYHVIPISKQELSIKREFLQVFLSYGMWVFLLVGSVQNCHLEDTKYIGGNAWQGGEDLKLGGREFHKVAVPVISGVLVVLESMMGIFRYWYMVKAKQGQDPRVPFHCYCYCSFHPPPPPDVPSPSSSPAPHVPSSPQHVPSPPSHAPAPKPPPAKPGSFSAAGPIPAQQPLPGPPSSQAGPSSSASESVNISTPRHQHQQPFGFQNSNYNQMGPSHSWMQAPGPQAAFPPMYGNPYGW